MVKLYWSSQTLKQRDLSGTVLNTHLLILKHTTSMLKGSRDSKESTVQFCTFKSEMLVFSKAAAGSGSMPHTFSRC